MNRKLTLLKNHQGFMKYFYNTSWMFAEQMLRMIAGVLVGIWVARYLGPEQFGIFSYALAFTSIFSGIAKLGLDSIVVRDLVNDPDKRDSYLGTAFWLKLIGAFITLGIIALATLFTSNNTTTNFYIFIIASGIIFQSFEVIDFYFQSKVLSKFVSLCKITQLLLSSALKLFFILTAADLFWFVVISLIDQVTLAVTLCIAYRFQRIGGFYYKFDLTIAKTLLKNSWTLILSGIAISIYMKIDQVIIKEMLGNKAVGQYSVAVRLSEVWLFITVIITSSLMPSILNAKKISQEFFENRIIKLYKLLFAISLAVSIVMFIFSKKIILFAYGGEYTDAIEILNIYIWSIILVFLNNGSWQWYIAENLQKIATIRLIFGAIINVILNIVLIDNYGLVGSAYATIISYFLASYLGNLIHKKTRINFIMQNKAILQILYLRR